MTIDLVERTVTGRARSGRWAWSVVLAVGVVLFELVRLTVLDTRNPSFLPSLILLGATVVPVAFLTFVASRQLSVDLGLLPVTLTAVLGGVLGTVVAGNLEYDTVRRLGVLPTVLVALIEETAKLLAPAALLTVPRYRRPPANGLVFGVASGAGFAALETMGYAATVLVTRHGDVGAVDHELLIRGLVSPGAHMAWTGLSAVAMWRLGEGWPTVLRFLAIFATAVGLHTVWDSSGGVVVYPLLALLAFGLLIVTTHRVSLPHQSTSGMGDQRGDLDPRTPSRKASGELRPAE